MPLDPPAVLRECMLRFKNHDPQVYEKFIETLEAYVADTAKWVVNAPGESVYVAQGQARMAYKFLQLFTELVREPKPPSPR